MKRGNAKEAGPVGGKVQPGMTWEKNVTRIKRLIGIVGLVMPLIAGAARAEYPEQPITLVVPFAAGGATDNLARGVCRVVTAQLGQPCVVINRSGAGTAIANAFVSQSRPDGYTLLLTTGSFSVINAISANLSYAGMSAFSPIAYLGEAPNAVVVSGNSPYRTVADFITAARADPGGLSFASSGVGSLNHLCGELMKIMGGFEMTHVAYRGAAPLITDVIGGRLSAGFTSLPSAMPLAQEGQVRILAVTTARRSAMLPSVPTVDEAGIPGYAASAYYGVFGPRLPQPIIDRLNEALRQVERDDSVRRWAAREGLVLEYGGPERLEEVARFEEARWRDVARRQGISIE